MKDLMTADENMQRTFHRMRGTEIFNLKLAAVSWKKKILPGIGYNGYRILKNQSQPYTNQCDRRQAGCHQLEVSLETGWILLIMYMEVIHKTHSGFTHYTKKVKILN